MLDARRAPRAAAGASTSSRASGCCTCPRARARRCRCATLPDLVGEFTDAGARACSTRSGGYDVLHANYWVSGAVGHRLKHELDLPLVTTFHTLDRVKAEVGLATTIPLRPRVEAEVVRCADLVVASTPRSRTSSCGTTAPIPSASRSSRRASTTRCSSPATATARAASHRRSTGGPIAAVRRSHPTAEGRRPRGARARRARRPRARRS